METIARLGCVVGSRSDRKAVRQSAAQCSARSRVGATAGTKNSASSTTTQPRSTAKLYQDPPSSSRDRGVEIVLMRRRPWP